MVRRPRGWGRVGGGGQRPVSRRGTTREIETMLASERTAEPPASILFGTKRERRLLHCLFVSSLIFSYRQACNGFFVRDSPRQFPLFHRVQLPSKKVCDQMRRHDVLRLTRRFHRRATRFKKEGDHGGLDYDVLLLSSRVVLKRPYRTCTWYDVPATTYST